MRFIQDVDNYARAWSRDSCMIGLVGFFYQDAKIIEAFENSILNLGKHQSEFGQIPSNVSPSGYVSYGTLVGRVDATIWWLIGACTLLLNCKEFNQNYASELIPKIYKALNILNIWEYNTRHLIYTPLGGNWADEYVSSGYTLYDNCLRYWAVKVAAELLNDSDLEQKSQLLA